MSTISGTNIIATVGFTGPSAAISTINTTTLNATNINAPAFGISVLNPISNTLQIGNIFTNSITLVASTITLSAQNTIMLGNLVTVSTTNLDVTDNNIRLNVGDSLGTTVLSSGFTIMSGSNPWRTFQLNNNNDFQLSGLSANALYSNTLSINTVNASTALFTTVSATNGIFNNISTNTLNVSTANISTLNVSLITATEIDATLASFGTISATSGFYSTISAGTITGLQNLNLSVLSVQSINVNNGQIYNNTTNGRVGINTNNPQAAIDLVGVTRIRTISNNAYLEFTPDVNGAGGDNMVRSFYNSGGISYEGTRTYYNPGNPSQPHSGNMAMRCAFNQLNLYTTQSNNDITLVGLPNGFTGGRMIQNYDVINTVDTTRISGNGWGFFLPYVSLSNLSHNIYGNVFMLGCNNGGNDPNIPLVVHCGSGSVGVGNAYGTGIQLTTHLSQDTAYTISALPVSECLRVNGRSYFNKRMTVAGNARIGCTITGSPGNETEVNGFELDSTLSTCVMEMHCVSNSDFNTQWDARIRAIGGTNTGNATGTLEITATNISFITPMVQMSYACTYQMNIISNLSASVGYIHNANVGNYLSANGIYCSNNITVEGYLNMGQTAVQSRERFSISGREFTTLIAEPILSTYLSTGGIMTWSVIGYNPVKGLSTNTCTYVLSTNTSTFYVYAGGLYDITLNLRETAGTNVVRYVQLEVSNDNVTWRLAYESRSGYHHNPNTTNFFTHHYDFLLDSNMESCKYFRFKYYGTSLGFGVNSALSPNGFCTRIMIKQIC
jgi:hypothetical protein